jgi:CelD/BcsL family acetyltransferase involved in cellulose biosynthesis
LCDTPDRFSVLAFEPTGGGDAVPIGASLSDEQGPVGSDTPALVDLVRAAGLVRWRFDHLPDQVVDGVNGVVVTDRSPSPVIDLHAEPRPSSLTTKARRWRRQLTQAHGPLRFESSVRGCEREQVLDQLMTWKSAQYRATAADDLFAHRWVRELVAALADHDAAPGTRPAFAERTSALWAGDRLVAAHLGLSSRTRWHYWLPAYDPELAAQSPGMVLLLDLVTAARTEGFERVELGKGNEPYKQRLATSSPDVLTGAVVVPGLAAKLRRASWRVSRRGARR